MLDALTDLLGDGGFRTGLVLGLVAVAAVVLGAVVTGRPHPWAGVAFGTAAVAAFAHRIRMEDELAAGLVVVAVGSALTAGRRPLVRMAAVLPGALVVALSTGVDEPAWAVPVVVVATVVGGFLVAESDRALGRTGLPPVLLAITTVGVYGTTPDTEHAVVLVGVALALVPLGWPLPSATLGVAGSSVVAAVVSWTAVVDGRDRPGAVVGAIACLGVLAVEPVRRWAPWRRDAGPRPAAGLRVRARDAVVVAALHAGLVAACSRVAGLRTPAVQALAIAAVAYALAAAVLVALVAVDARRTASAEERPDP